MTTYDVIVVGGGPGGYVAAIRAAKEGRKTALVEQDILGGTCLNRGCIPSKTLLKHAEIIEQIDKAQNWGIETQTVRFNWGKMQERKEEVVQTLRNGITGLLKAGKIDVYNSYGKIISNKVVQLEDKEINGEKIILATGSKPIVPRLDGLDTIEYQTTDTIFDIDYIPSSLVIVGGGVIGVELANIYSSLHTKVTIVELGERIIPTEDEEAAKLLLKNLEKKGIEVLTNHQVVSVSEKGNGAKEITVHHNEDKEVKLQANELLFTVGRTPNIEAVADLNLAMNGRFIQVDEYLETSESGIFAVGDVIGNFQLAHVASSEGLTAVANLDRPSKKASYKVVPRCVYTTPQIASVGLSEKELKEKGIAYHVYNFKLAGNGMALATGETDGFSKVMIDEKYGEILGVVMVGNHVTEMINQSSAYMYLEGTVEELADMVHPHPSLSEALMESANALLGKGIHTL